MPVDRRTSDQFQGDLRTALLGRTTKFDTAYGPVKDVVIQPLSSVLEDQNNNRLRPVSLLISLQNENEFSEDDLDGLVFNEDITRPEGSNASVILTFSRTRAFTSGESGLVPRGLPIGTDSDESTGQSVTFVTTETKDKASALAVLDTTTNRIVYQLRVPAICLITGAAGKVGPNRVNRPLRPMLGWESVTNEESAQEGRDRYSQSELIELYLLAVNSRQLSVPTGTEFYVRDNFPGVQDIHTVFGTDPLLTRAATDAGAVDAFVIGDDLFSTTDQLPFLGIGQKIVLSTPPVVRVDTVKRVSDNHVYLEGTDYRVTLDTTGKSGSTRALDGIRFLSTVDPAFAPANGAVISISYAYNQLVRDLQADSTDPEVRVLGRDLLFRLGTPVDIFLSAQLKALSGFVFSDIHDAVTNVILAFIGTLGLGDPVEAFDIENVVGGISGVDNFILTRLTRSSTAEEVADVLMNGNEKALLSTTNFLLSAV